MKEKDPTNAELIKVIEHCTSGTGCNGCIARNTPLCKEWTENVIDLIRHQQKEVERLTKSNKNILFVNEYTIKQNEELQKQVDELKSRRLVFVKPKAFNESHEEFIKQLSNQFIPVNCLDDIEIKVIDKLCVNCLQSIEKEGFCIDCHEEVVKLVRKDTAKEIWNDITSHYFALRVLGNATVELDKLAEFWHKYGVDVE